MCLGGLHDLPGGGAAWLQGARRDGSDGGAGAGVVVSLIRSDARRPPRFSAAEVRELAALLTALADELERPGALPR